MSMATSTVVAPGVVFVWFWLYWLWSVLPVLLVLIIPVLIIIAGFRGVFKRIGV